MTYSWNTKFNVSPSGADFGSVTGKIIRETKEAFYERLEVQHEITEGATPEVYHSAGKSTVIQFGTSEEELEHIIPQSLFYDFEVDKLYSYDKDANQGTIGSIEHSDYENLDADDHTQYAKKLEEVTGALTVDEFTSIGTSSSTPYLLDDTVHTGEDHSPIDAGDFNLSISSHMKHEIVSVSGTNTEVDLPRYSEDQRVFCTHASVDGFPIAARAELTYDGNTEYIPAYIQGSYVYVFGVLLYEAGDITPPLSVSTITFDVLTLKDTV